ncbi:type VI secretion system accessory protein TagJ [Achromobacter aegrifaciens]|uniref:type VI secretion system accessory protein TagJ n=1 Tax=Achromobacter aegrifaciens TaxID=1287736 RepID=UPI0027B99CEC|nr:type VI secretion system accessory protein TagJ [Achromobacter aegrifaciens]WLW61703.1 type VI secretion system accessory protein TagJ [Achromobacter aegrifaciens]
MSIAAVPFGALSLAGQLDELQAQVRRQPADADLRAQLFQLLAVQGDWARAAEQLNVCGHLNAQARPTQVLYASAIAAEREREAVLAGQGEPALLGEPADWLRAMISALRLDGTAPAQAAELRGKAFEDASARAGLLELAAQETAQPFQWICDGDSRLGPVFEFLASGRYVWLPFAALKRVRLLAPEGLCDLVWAQAEIELEDGRVRQGLVPARYPAAPGARMVELSDSAKLGRTTDWRALQGDTYAGVGQKMWLTDAADIALLEVRSLELA